MTVPSAEWLTKKQVADGLQRTERHVTNLIRRGEIPDRLLKRDGVRSLRIHRSVVYGEAAKPAPVSIVRLTDQDKDDIAERVLARLGELFGHVTGQRARSIG